MIKKLSIAVFIILILVLSSGLAFAGADENSAVVSNPSFSLPPSVKVIGEEAFEGTAIQKLIIPDSVEIIENRAFANTEKLRSVYLPEEIIKIGEDVFDGAGQIIITGRPGGHARAWAIENGLPFSPEVMLVAGNGCLQISIDFGNGFHFSEIAENETITCSDEKPSWRPFWELKAEQYYSIIANQVQGRSPPLCI